jgi:hypothetical protein
VKLALGVEKVENPSAKRNQNNTVGLNCVRTLLENVKILSSRVYIQKGSRSRFYTSCVIYSVSHKSEAIGELGYLAKYGKM